mgnify:CR=1 FL=1
MGLFADRDSISVTEIRQVVSGAGRNWGDQDSAALGKAEHKRILDALVEQVTPSLPGFSSRTTAVRIDSGQIMGREELLNIEMNESLQLKVRPDAVVWDGETLSCIEIKPAYNSLYLLQLMYECMAASETYGGAIQGLLYLYGRRDTVKILQNGGKPFWDQGKKIAVLARELRASKNSKIFMVADIAVTDYRERAAIYRRELDQIWRYVSQGLSDSTW